MKKSKRSVYLKIKRYIDCFLAVWAILLIWPLFLAICVAIKLDSKGSVFFTQKRVGFAGRLFDIYKFRTMYEYAPKDVPTHMLDDPEEYITGVGAFLRKYGYMHAFRLPSDNYIIRLPLFELISVQKFQFFSDRFFGFSKRKECFVS